MEKNEGLLDGIEPVTAFGGFPHWSDAGQNTRGRFALQERRDSDKLEMCWSASESTRRFPPGGRSSLM